MKINIKLKLWSSEISCHIILHFVTSMIEDFTALVYVSNFVYKVDSFAANTGYMKLDENIKECKKFSDSFNNYNTVFLFWESDVNLKMYIYIFFLV